MLMVTGCLSQETQDTRSHLVCGQGNPLLNCTLVWTPLMLHLTLLEIQRLVAEVSWQLHAIFYEQLTEFTYLVERVHLWSNHIIIFCHSINEDSIWQIGIRTPGSRAVGPVPFKWAGSRLSEGILVNKFSCGGNIWRKIVIVVDEAVVCCQDVAQWIQQHVIKTKCNVCECWTTLGLEKPAWK